MDILPEELLLAIFEIVVGHHRPGKLTNNMRRTQNLHPLVLVSHKFNRIVTPLLYESIQCPHFRTSDFWKNITYTLKERPRLGQLIRCVQTPRNQPFFADFAPKDLKSIITFDLVTDLYHQDLRTFQKRSQRGENVMLLFLVLQAPTVEKLDLFGFQYDPPEGSSRDVLPLVVEEMGRMIYADLDTSVSPVRFASLRNLRLDFDEWTCFPPGAVLPFLTLPQLKILTLDSWGWTGNDRKHRTDLYGLPREWPLRSSSVEELYLYGVIAEPSKVSSLLNSCKALKVFQYSIYSARRIFLWHQGAVSKALLDHADSLEVLSFLPEELSPLQAPKDSLEHSTRLAHLKDLRMPYYLLIGTVEPFNTPPNKASEIAQRLPSSLERLVVVFSHSLHVGTWDDLDDIILGISESICTAHVNSALPNLKRVELVINDDGDLGLCMPKFNIEAFRSVLASRQVQLDVSLCVKPGDHEVPSRDEMRALKTVFPSFVHWSRAHRNLKASSCTEQCIPWRIGEPRLANNVPHYPVYMPWDFENEDEPPLLGGDR